MELVTEESKLVDLEQGCGCGTGAEGHLVPFGLTHFFGTLEKNKEIVI